MARASEWARVLDPASATARFRVADLASKMAVRFRAVHGKRRRERDGSSRHYEHYGRTLPNVVADLASMMGVLGVRFRVVHGKRQSDRENVRFRMYESGGRDGHVRVRFRMERNRVAVLASATARALPNGREWRPWLLLDLPLAEVARVRATDTSPSSQDGGGEDGEDGEHGEDGGGDGGERRERCDTEKKEGLKEGKRRVKKNK
ncbi:hypothetical protein DFH11DRAFT_1548159 [Phellopilus nigrolimitatus]|nr:hypothetical protein DFH11DRAFT_1548159 [Phellopilus nigrolimitatus]